MVSGDGYRRILDFEIDYGYNSTQFDWFSQIRRFSESVHDFRNFDLVTLMNRHRIRNFGLVTL